MKSNLAWSVYEFKIIQNLNVIEWELTEEIQRLCNFTFLTTLWPITSWSSKVVCERIKLNRTDVIALACTPWQISQKCARKKQGQPQSQTNKRWVLFETDNESVVSLGYIWPGVGAKVNRPAMSPQDRGGNPYKSLPTFFYFLKNLCYVAIPAYYTWTSLSSSLHILPSEFASRLYSTSHKTAVIASLCHIQHHTQ